MHVYLIIAKYDALYKKIYNSIIRVLVFQSIIISNKVTQYMYFSKEI